MAIKHKTLSWPVTKKGNPRRKTNNGYELKSVAGELEISRFGKHIGVYRAGELDGKGRVMMVLVR